MILLAAFLGKHDANNIAIISQNWALVEHEWLLVVHLW
jgi:hypothetical protein